MRKETNDAVNAVVKDLTALTGTASMDASTHMLELITLITGLESDLHDCVNELCLQCGKYHHAYDGACIGCRWLEVKEGFR